MKKQKENSHEGITWSEMGKQNVQAEKVYWLVEKGRKSNRAARAARFLVQFFDVLCQMTTRKLAICGSDDNACPQR